MPANPCMMVIFGASGDLTKRLLFPALCNLGASGHLPEQFAIVGIARTEHTDASFRAYLLEQIEQFGKTKEAKAYARQLLQRVHVLCGDASDKELYPKLASLLVQLQVLHGYSTNCIFYLATLPQYVETIVRSLGELGLLEEVLGRFRRVVIEKPFGSDYDSALRLNQAITEVINESQIFRIDHYLGKETVQNLLAFRFANGIFEPIWNHQYIDHVQITVAESLGVERRGNYYELAGALRDMVPNHVFQLLTLIAMEPPSSFDPDAVRDEKAKVLRAVQPIQDVSRVCVRGQYDTYRQETDVFENSNIETYVALKLMIDNWRFAGVPFYLRTGKKLARRVTEIAIQFKTAPSMMFHKTQVDALSPNVLVIEIQPEEGIYLRFGAKIPGPIVRIGDVNMRFHYKDYFGAAPGTGYETLLYDCMMGDQTQFQRADMLLQAWKVVAPILDAFQEKPKTPFPNYTAGSMGPKEADLLIEADKRKWRSLDEKRGV